LVIPELFDEFFSCKRRAVRCNFREFRSNEDDAVPIDDWIPPVVIFVAIQQATFAFLIAVWSVLAD
jgi:hypothetical protein